MRLATWNLQWATPRSRAAQRVRELIEAASAEVFVATEIGDPDLLGSGHLIDGGRDWGYGVQPVRRKVAMWSTAPWSDVDRLKSVGLPPGRCVSGITDVGLGPFRVIGVCIPWSGAHVSSGRRDSSRWSEHRTFLIGLGRALGGMSRDLPIVVAGDFNQALPRSRQPKDVADLLRATLSQAELTVVTAGLAVPGSNRLLIDHVATSPETAAVEVNAWSGDGCSDHHGALVTLAEGGTNPEQA